MGAELEQAEVQTQVTPEVTSTEQVSTSTEQAGATVGEGYGVIEWLRKNGHEIDESQFTDDFAFVSQAAEALKQREQLQAQLQKYQRFAKEIGPRLGEFKKWQALQREQQEQQAAQKKPSRWFEPPEYDPSWVQHLEPDEEQGFKLRPGSMAPPDIIDKYRAYVAKRTEFANKFLDNPVETLEPFKKEILQEVVGLVQQNLLAPRDAQTQAQSILATNATWMYERDQNGTPLLDGNGRPQLSKYGSRYRDIVIQLANDGFTDARKTNEYALQLLRGEVAAAAYENHLGTAQQQTAAVEQVNEAKKQEYVQSAARTPNSNGVTKLKAPATEELKGLSLEQKMLRRLGQAT